MRRFPNSSIISIITRGNMEQGLDILHINTKPVPDIYEGENVFWYQGKGKLGKASLVWEKLELRQWVAHGRDGTISQLYDHIILQRSITVDDQIVNFKLPLFTKCIVSPNPYFDRNQNDIIQLVISDIQYFPPELLIEENLKILCGYKLPVKNINPFFPLGFFEKNYLHKRFLEGVIGEKHERIPYLTFHGVAEPGSKKREINSMTGFYQEDFKGEDNYIVKFKDSMGKENGECTVSKDNGVFLALTDKEANKGCIFVERNVSAIRSLEYTLMKNIVVNIDVASGNITDAYGEQHMIVPKTKVRPENFIPCTWHKSDFGSASDASKILSQKFQDMMNYMGPRILIADPYYINNIKHDLVQKKPVLTACQIALLNALSICATSTTIDEINFLGSNSRAKVFFEKDSDIPETTSEQRFIRYEELFREFIRDSGLTSYFKTGSIIFLNATKDFHNRYWFSLSEDKKALEKCVIVTNSIGNMTEVDFIEVTDELQLKKITGKYFNLFKTASNELVI